jgi:hypothetical protein
MIKMFALKFISDNPVNSSLYPHISIKSNKPGFTGFLEIV